MCLVILVSDWEDVINSLARTNMNDQKSPYRLEVKTKDTDEPWKYVMDFGSDNLASCWEMMKGMNRVHTSLLLQIVPNLGQQSCS